ncbi:MAG: (Fe-S)-binding protein [Methylococcales bacterium]|nr:(Fe-S)-binding protein [Methylococcales bacterium]
MTNAKKELLAIADSCVKCGICTPHCPTYTHIQNENESPRGRIALIQAWAGGQLNVTDNLLEHIDSCLLCRACEKSCPAVVPYAKLIDDFRAEMHGEKSAPISVRLVKTFAENKPAHRWIKLGLAFYQQYNLQKIARFLRVPTLFGLEKLERLVPNYQESQTLQSYYPATSEVKGDAGLFVGCMGEMFDFETVNAAIIVLTHVGFNVHLPETQTCCGALALHEGDTETAQNLAKQNQTAFASENLQAIITIASGCGSTLKDYAPKVVDISHFLAQTNFDLKPLAANIRVHSPCSLKNVLKTDKSVLTLLKRIPEANISSLPDTTQCCGAAGSYSLRHDKMAQTLLNELLENALEKPTDYLVSSNIGCALHIAAGLRERGENVTVVHPVVLLARQLR